MPQARESGSFRPVGNSILIPLGVLTLIFACCVGCSDSKSGDAPGFSHEVIFFNNTFNQLEVEIRQTSEENDGGDNETRSENRGELIDSSPVGPGQEIRFRIQERDLNTLSVFYAAIAQETLCVETPPLEGTIVLTSNRVSECLTTFEDTYALLWSNPSSEPVQLLMIDDVDCQGTIPPFTDEPMLLGIFPATTENPVLRFEHCGDTRTLEFASPPPFVDGQFAIVTTTDCGETTISPWDRAPDCE